jgi:tRNA (guanine10-N2)-methyltransferase
MEKNTEVYYPPPSFDNPQRPGHASETHIPAHQDFRVKYFQGFKKDNENNSR